jgi:hypothetical protein
MKISRHNFFRNVSSRTAVEMLREKNIGEFLIRPNAFRRDEAIFSVKIGRFAVAHWAVREERNPNGTFRYVLQDRRTSKSHVFDDPDHVIECFIAKAIGVAQRIRSHRKFVPDARDVGDKLREQLDTSKGSLAYVFAETSRDDSVAPTYYKLFYRLAARDCSLRIHLDHQYAYLRLPKLGDGSRRQQLAPCKNAEQLSAIFKAWVDALTTSTLQRNAIGAAPTENAHPDRRRGVEEYESALQPSYML